MRRLGLAIVLMLFSITAVGQRPPRVALIDFAGDNEGQLRAVILTAANTLDLIDAAQTRAAARGAGYTGSLNLRREEARDLGASLGCDFYFLGKTWNVRRLGSDRETYFESSAAVFLVESHTGSLLLFDLVRSKSGTDAEALAAMKTLLKARSAGYIAMISAAVERILSERTSPSNLVPDEIEILDGDVTRGKTVAPVFFQRLKPVYTDDAALADVAATVEIKAVFGSDGTVGEIEVERWAGFGLDESAKATVRALRFKPASREGRPIKVRAMVRYNFVKPPSAAEREAEAERLRRSLRQSVKP